jgi:transmembrane sensor
VPKAQDRSRTAPSITQPDDALWDEALDWLLLIEASPLDADLRTGLAHWLAQGAAQKAAYARAQEVWRVTAGMPRSGQAQRRAPRPGRRAARWAAAAAIGAGLLLAALPYLRIQVLADYRTAVGETRAITLPDGSVVTLDSDSAIDIDRAPGKAGDRTVILLAGRAYFEVAHDGAPFAAIAEDVTVQVHGTAFDLGLAESGITVALKHGAVSLTGPGGAHADLRPGERAVFDRRQRGWQIGQIPVGDIAAWRAGQLVAHNATVADVVAELDRYRAGLILLQDRALATRKVTGVFDLRDPAAALRAVLQPFGGRITAVTPYLLIVEGA